MGRVEGKVALVTGGASGIGLAAANLLLDEGAKVVLTDREQALSAPALALLRHRASIRSLDVTREAIGSRSPTRSAAEFGRIDIVVNSAGTVLLKDIETTTLDEWRALMAVNLDGTFLGCKHAVRVMKDRGGGSIVNMSSVAGIIGVRQSRRVQRQQGRRATADEIGGAALRPQGLQHPLQFGTPVVCRNADAAVDDRVGARPEEAGGQFYACGPARPAGAADEIARTILFLASDEVGVHDGRGTRDRRRSYRGLSVHF